MVDCVAVRASNAAQTASRFEFTRLLVEVVEAAPDPIRLGIASAGNDVTLTWANAAFALQAAPTVAGTYTNVTGAASPYTVPAGEAQKFFRLVYP